MTIRRLLSLFLAKVWISMLLSWATLVLYADGLGFPVRGRWSFWWSVACLGVWLLPNPRSWRSDE